MRKKVFLTLISFLLICATLFTGCQNQSNANTDTDTESQTTDVIAGYLSVIDANGNSEFRIVRASGANGDVLDAAIALYRRLSNKYKVVLPLVADNANGETGTVSNDAYEVLIGATNRAESQELLATLGVDDYTICVKGNKLMIVGGSDVATVYAVDVFLKNVVSSASAEVGIQMKVNQPIFGKYESNTMALHKDADMRIMTLNVSLNNYEPDVRKTHILNLIKKYDPEVLCLQECNAANYSRIIDNLDSSIYKVAFKTHADGSGILIYTPIIYRADKIQLVESGGGWLDSRYTGTATKSYSWAVLQLKDSGKTFAVTNLHGAVAGRYPGYENYSDEQLLQLANQWTIDNVRQLFNIIDSIKAKHGNIAFLCAGDFNFDKNMIAYALATSKGLVEAETHATVSKVTGYDTCRTPGTVKAGVSIDHIFYFPETVTAYVHYIGVKTEDELKASDHLMVYADVGF